VRTVSAVEDGTGAPAESNWHGGPRVPTAAFERSDYRAGVLVVRRAVEPGTHLRRRTTSLG